MSEQFFLLRIGLLNIKPEIWRRFVVPADISLDRLHDVIQIVMGWRDSHLHEFTIKNQGYTEYPEEEADGLPCGDYRLKDLINRRGQTFGYLYDFGDSWDHELKIEKTRYPAQDMHFGIECLDGARACPQEDVGGIGGYCEFCEALKDPEHEEHESYMRWCGGNYDSEKFDIDAVNWELTKYQRWSRDRNLLWDEYDV